MGSSAISIEHLQEFQESRPDDGEQETGWVCERWCHRSFCHQNIIRITSDRSCSAKHKYGQKSWSKNGAELSIILLWSCHSAFCFGVTPHPWTKHVFSLSFCCFEIKKCFFQRVFWQKKNLFIYQTPTYKIKASQSWRLKVVWLWKWLDAWKWHEVTKQILSSYLLKLNHASYN